VSQNIFSRGGQLAINSGEILFHQLETKKRCIFLRKSNRKISNFNIQGPDTVLPKIGLETNVEIKTRSRLDTPSLVHIDKLKTSKSKPMFPLNCHTEPSPESLQ